MIHLNLRQSTTPPPEDAPPVLEERGGGRVQFTDVPPDNEIMPPSYDQIVEEEAYVIPESAGRGNTIGGEKERSLYEWIDRGFL